MAFDGFDPRGWRFLAQLRRNNNRDWFEAHKADYQAHVLTPAQAFVETLGERLRRIHPDMCFDTRTNGSGSIFRIYRDVRFSKDKTPYKTHLGIRFWRGLRPAKMDNPGLYVGIDEKGARVHAGKHQFSKHDLAAYRNALAAEKTGRQLSRLLATLTERGYETGGLHYKRLPRGVDPATPFGDLLRHNALTASSPQIEKSRVCERGFVADCVTHARRFAALNDWLAEHLY